jgi:hypothetical protein
VDDDDLDDDNFNPDREEGFASVKKKAKKSKNKNVAMVAKSFKLILEATGTLN